MPPLIDVRNLTKTYWLGEVTVNALVGVTVTSNKARTSRSWGHPVRANRLS